MIRLRNAKAGTTNATLLRWRDFRRQYGDEYEKRRELLVPADHYRALERIARPSASKTRINLLKIGRAV